MTEEVDNRFFTPSAKALVDRREQQWKKEFESLFKNCPVGMSFMMPLTVGKIGSIRSALSRDYNNAEKTFKVTQHEDCYEIYRKE